MMRKFLKILFFFILFIDFYSDAQSNSTTTDMVTIRVGIAASQYDEVDMIGWPTGGGAINLALERLKSDGYLKPFNFEFFLNFTECNRSLAAEVGFDFIRNKKVDVIIGPSCKDPLEVLATMSTYYQIPILAWGMTTDSKFTDSTRYPYLTNIVANSLSMGYTLVKILEMMNWNTIALLYEKNSQEYSLSLMNDIETAINDPKMFTTNVVVKQELPLFGTGTTEQYKAIFDRVKSRARIIIVSLMNAASRRFYLELIKNQSMDNDEYVHIMITLRSVGFGKQANDDTKLSSGLVPIWISNEDNLSDELKIAATRILVLDVSSDVQDKAYLSTFTENVVRKVVEQPVSCLTNSCQEAFSSKNAVPTGFARSLHDAFYLYGLAMTNLYNINPLHLNDPSRITDAMQINFQGLTGEVKINTNSTRVPALMLYALDNLYDQKSFMNLTYSLSGSTTVSLGYEDEASLWYWYNGKRPLSTPICGFYGLNCPKTFLDQYGALIFSLGSVLAVALLLLVFFIFYIIRQKKLEKERINAEWQIAFNRLQKPPKKDKERQSKRSLQSGPSTITETSKFTFDSEFSNYSVYYFEKEAVLTTKHPPSNLFKQDYEHFVKLRKLDHDNCNKFIGLSIDSAEYIAVWKMCMRGSLQDIIVQGNFSLDPFFMFCIIRDVAEGLKYLHSSFLHVHANLRSATCLVNESWQVKLTDFGIGFLMEEKKPTKKRQLWMAPEVLRGALLPHQIEKSADIYSFSIICSEILTRKPAWNINERKESVDEILYLLKKGGNNPIRPELDLDGVEISSNLLHLVRDCWNEEAQDRPTIDVISNLLRNMMPTKKTNLMDHVFNILEEYTTTLELEVEERTKELSAEKKKADVLLGRMLPKQVAERLKQGQTVEPEGFDSVTVFFSDVVKFTQLAAKCSPFQVVNLLNDLYSNFDSIIEEHENYKVESIGDGYLCVSGLPVRNGNAHIKQIIEMSLDFMSYVKSFKIPHLPREKVELRIGVNSGPCVAGVVGLSMPRYCLFGDTVNTASRMESNGKASHIHMTAAAHNLLITNYPNQYETQSRGDVIIKGKGVMETFWIHGRSTDHLPSEKTISRTPPMQHQNIGTEFLNEDVSKPRNRQRRASIPSATSPTSSKRSVSPIFEMKKEENGNEALYRQFRQSETFALM